VRCHRKTLFCLNLKAACDANLESIYWRNKTRVCCAGEFLVCLIVIQCCAAPLFLSEFISFQKLSRRQRWDVFLISLTEEPRSTDCLTCINRSRDTLFPCKAAPKLKTTCGATYRQGKSIVMTYLAAHVYLGRPANTWTWRLATRSSTERYIISKKL
jgi:hypothetical protein